VARARGGRGTTRRRDDGAPPLEWPPFLDGSEVDFLVSRVVAAAKTRAERSLFLDILGSAYANVLELEALYRELPGVLDDDPAAMRLFRRTLDRGIDLAGGMRRPRTSLDALGLKPVPDGGGFPCEPAFLVQPFIIAFIALGVDRLSAGDPELREGQLDGLWALWERGGHLEEINEHARRGRGALRDFMRIMGRDLPGDRRPSRGPRGGAFGLPAAGEFPLPPQPLPLPPLPLPGGSKDLCGLIKDACKFLVIGGISGLTHVPGSSTYATGITSLSPSTACYGNQVTINGSFPATKPADVEVIIGTVVAPVVSWSDIAIVITVPQGTASGCVAFRNKTLEALRADAAAANQEAIASVAEGFACMGQHRVWPKAPQLKPSTAPCTATNFLSIGPPVVSFGASPAQVTPGTQVFLNWSVQNATTFRVRRTSPAGPFIDVTNPPGTSASLGGFAGAQDTDAVYELTATNSCGTTTRTVTVELRQPPTLAILGVEVVQSVQRFAFGSPAQQNTVRLAARKRTMVRVYVDSGISNGFDNGAGANRQPNVTGRVTVFPPGASAGTTAVLRPAGATISARPLATINRDRLDHSLNFELPSHLIEGAVRLEARVWVTGHENEVGTRRNPWGTALTVNFQPRRAQPVVRIFVRDTNQNLPVPTAAQYETSRTGARTRYPVAFAGGMPIFLAPGFETINSAHDLRTRAGWDDLLDDIADIADGFVDNGEIWTGLVPNQANYNLNGLGTVGGTQPHMLARAAFPATFAHELGHNFGLMHANCGLAAGDTPDARLPAATEDTGMDVFRTFVVPNATSEIMSTCTPTWAGATFQDRWPSIAFWDIVFDALP
jgi:hypothetical protein